MDGFTEHHYVDCPRRTPTCLVTSDVLDSIGHTPLIRMEKMSAESGCAILAKAEFLNPGGSIKDRVAVAMLQAAREQVIGAVRSVGVKTASPAANGASTSWSTSMLSELTHLTRFCTESVEPVTMCASTSSRAPYMPRGSLTPSWPSIENPRGIMCSTS